MAICFHGLQLMVCPFFFILFLLFSSSNSVSFRFSRFNPNSAGILYQGDAVPLAGAVEFNKANYISRVGWATYAESVPIWDSDTGKITDFTTNCTFAIHKYSSYGHGIAFFLAPVGFQIPPNSAAGFLGLFNSTISDSSRNQIVLFEFDSFPNPDWDPPFQHVGINVNSIASANHTAWNASLHGNETVHVWISYNSTTMNLSAAWRYKNTSSAFEQMSLSYLIDLKKVLPQWVTVGFSAATGVNYERHTLMSWEFNSNLEPKVARDNNWKKVHVIVGVSVFAVVLIAGVALTVLWTLKKHRKREH